MEKFVLSEGFEKKLSTALYYPGLMKLAGKEVTPKGFAVRRMDPEQRILVTLCGVDGRDYDVPLCCFAVHPSEEKIRKNNHLRIK